VSRNRFVAATVVAAAALGVPGSALAIGAAGQGSKSTTPPAATGPVSKAPALSNLTGLASSAGITETKLEAGLTAAKQAGGNNASAVAAFARATGVSPGTAQKVVSSVFGVQINRSLTGPSAVAALATQLGVSTAAAHSALDQLGALGRTQGVDPGSAAFAAIAHGLGVTPTRLATALPLVKQALRATGG
jgi:hypothetical protein